ncbi:tetratricopeptide repeat protein [Dankookia rubra]|uniref:Tetratricopeptide repeat protein n=1 Tax=Dankookia rubra TaxID=1442381 RepID=A0A4R5QC59_9PROT|nr:tetratricopeptide repeat protein [Dankookia rubra]TDH60001.1 tetratricopeptide repeat protein [Dankookia rubra]
MAEVKDPLAQAHAALKQRDWLNALRLSETVEGDGARAYSKAVVVGTALRELRRFDEADAAFSEVLQHYPTLECEIGHAYVAHQRGDWAEAVSRWERLTQRHEDNLAILLPLLDALRALGNFGRVEGVLATAMASFPANPALLTRHARSASDRRDLPEAVRRWQDVADQQPDDVLVQTGLGSALREVGRLDEADRILQAAIERFPNHAETMAAFAWVAHHRRNWAEALRRWQALQAAFPNLPIGAVGVGHALRLLGNFDEAEAHYSSALERFPLVPELQTGYASTATERKDWREALIRWRAATLRFPNDPNALNGEARVWAELGRSTEADLLFTSAMTQFPHHEGLVYQHAMAANLREDWDEAVRRWTKAAERFPGRPAFTSGLSTAEYQRRIHATDRDIDMAPAIVALAIRPGDVLAIGEDLPELLLHFESIGDNCEFGGVQRKVGAEPIGLLRWSRTLPANILAAMEAKFEGIGLPENTSIYRQNGTYNTEDRRFGMGMHTFIPEHQQEEAVVLRQFCRRLQYLQRNFLRDMAEGKKIFVYKSSTEYLSDTFVVRLARLMRALGPSNLLVVRAQEEGRAPGRVDQVAENALIGYVDRLSPPDNAMDISFESWFRLCRKAYQVHQDMLRSNAA